MPNNIFYLWVHTIKMHFELNIPLFQEFQRNIRKKRVCFPKVSAKGPTKIK